MITEDTEDYFIVAICHFWSMVFMVTLYFHWE